MCNLAGYIGSESAAPILLQMIKAQEGFGGGYFTGIATIHEGVLHWRKVIGNSDQLLKQTDALELPGNIGIVHSRSKGYGDIEWGHPFVNPSESMALIANGHMGPFYDNKTNSCAIVRELLEHDYKFRTRVTESVPGMFNFEREEGSIHMSEIMCLYADYQRGKSNNWTEALKTSASRYPAEVVILMLCADEPECIHAARFNQPLMVGRTPDATYLSTTALAFPEKLDSIIQAPVRSAMTFANNSFSVYPLQDNTGKIADIMPIQEGCNIIKKLLSDGKGHTLTDLKNATRSLWPEDMAPQKDMMVYEILRLMHELGKIRFEDSTVAGISNNLTAPVKLVFSI